MARKIAVADAETDPFKPGRTEIRPFLWGYYDGETYEEFEKTIDFIQFIYDKPIILYAHNGGKFDWHFIMDYIDPFSDVMIINGRLSKFKIGECEFRDSYNILPTPLSAYQKTEIDYNIFEKEERYKPHNWKKISNYLYDDCVDLYSYVSAFIDRFGISLTLAGAAMKQWEKISGQAPPNDVGGLVYEQFKKYYYGGRCQSFETGNINADFSMVDINSAYPFAMLSDHPMSLDFIELQGNEWADIPDAEKGPTFVSVKAISHGALPFREKSGALAFPDDGIERIYDVTGWELLAAIETNSITITEYLSAFQFYGLGNFEEYVTHFYNEKSLAKATGDVLGYIFAKLFLNTLYGKFGSNPENYNNYQVVPPETIDKNGCVNGTDKFDNECIWYYSGEFGEKTLISAPLHEDEQRFYNVATAASITGFVRAYLWRALCQSNRPLYCDTDSIAAESFKRLPGGYGKELGQWESEGDFDFASLCGKKLYAMKYKGENKHKIASKGVKLNEKELFKVANGLEVTYTPMSPSFSVHRPPVIISRKIQMKKA